MEVSLENWCDTSRFSAELLEDLFGLMEVYVIGISTVASRFAGETVTMSNLSLIIPPSLKFAMEFRIVQ